MFHLGLHPGFWPVMGVTTRVDLADRLCPVFLSAVILTHEHLDDISGEVCDECKVPFGFVILRDLGSHTCQQWRVAWQYENVVYVKMSHKVIILSYLSSNQLSSLIFQ